MKTREMLGITASRLGMGLMRLPTVQEEIDYTKAEAMIDMLMAGGVTYYDTAWFYHNKKSEEFARKALIERYPRNSYTIATKLPVGELESKEECLKRFERQRENLGVDKIDFYLLHGIGKSGWERSLRIGAHELQLELKEKGLISFAGFSFHGPAAELPGILDQGKWDFVQLQLNYADWYFGDAKILYEETVKRGVPIIVMEPVRGGGLSNLPAAAVDMVKSLNMSQAELALRWVAALPGVDVILSGMSNAEQVEENMRIFSQEIVTTPSEKETVEKVIESYKTLPTIDCTQCKYCAECPQEIEIFRYFNWYNEYIKFGSTWPITTVYPKIPDGKKASACIECGACEQICPQRLQIIQSLKLFHAKALELANA